MSIEKLEQPNPEKIIAAEYLKSGPQTEITPQIEVIASKFEGSFEEKIKQIFGFLRKIKHNSEIKGVKRLRTADKIITDGFETGCADEALVFISLARACGIPAKYIETVNLQWLIEDKEEYFGGHVYSEIFDDKNNNWITVDPDKRELNVNIETDNRVFVDQGLDAWDIFGVHDTGALEEKLREFREQYIKNHANAERN